MKRYTRTLIALWLLAVMVLAAGCAQPAPEPEPEPSAWEVTVESAAGPKVVAIEAMQAMTVIELEAEKKGEVNKYTGVKMSEVLASVGITAAEKVTLTAEDGFAAEISGASALSDNTILAWQKDGAELDPEKAAPLMVVAKDESTKAWVGKIKTIKVE